MAYTTPRTWVTGELVTAALLNTHLRDNLNAAFPLGVDAWTSWTPTLTNLTLGNGSSVAAYHKVGRTVHWRWRFLLGTTSAVGTNPTITLPVAPAAAYAGQDPPIGHAAYMDQGVATYSGPATFTGASSATLGVWNAAGTYMTSNAVTATVPFTFGNTDAIFAWGTYEAAS